VLLAISAQFGTAATGQQETDTAISWQLTPKACGNGDYLVRQDQLDQPRGLEAVPATTMRDQFALRSSVTTQPC